MKQNPFELNSAVKPALLAKELWRPDWVNNNPRPDDALWIDKNENLDPELLSFTNSLLKNLDPRAIATYPDSGPVYRKLGEYLGIDPKLLRLTPGSDGGIRLAFDAFVSAGDKVLHTTPTFAMYPVYCKMFGAQEIQLPYEASTNGPQLAFSTLLDIIAREQPKLVCLPNPDSPTGTIITLDQLRELAQICLKSGAALLIDEAYYPISSVTAQPLLSEFPNLIIVRTFAKAWGLAGLRIGYTLASAEVTAVFHKLRPMYEVNTLAIFVLNEMLHHTSQMEQSTERLLKGRDFFMSEMAKLGFKGPKTHGNFVHVAFGDNAPAIHQALDGKVLYRKSFAEPCLAGYSRFSLTTIDQFRPVVELIKKGLSL